MEELNLKIKIALKKLVVPFQLWFLSKTIVFVFAWAK